ncbi:hypothetical protein C8R45DRAFT_1078185 [Mycena sanguinolenta]|nr:hypothetical protein C8R45DRAFT_1078185 [Mycena sanguinolenta]
MHATAFNFASTWNSFYPGEWTASNILGDRFDSENQACQIQNAVNRGVSCAYYLPGISVTKNMCSPPSPQSSYPQNAVLLIRSSRRNPYGQSCRLHVSYGSSKRISRRHRIRPSRFEDDVQVARLALLSSSSPPLLAHQRSYVPRPPRTPPAALDTHTTLTAAAPTSHTNASRRSSPREAPRHAFDPPLPPTPHPPSPRSGGEGSLRHRDEHDRRSESAPRADAEAGAAQSRADEGAGACGEEHLTKKQVKPLQASKSTLYLDVSFRVMNATSAAVARSRAPAAARPIPPHSPFMRKPWRARAEGAARRQAERAAPAGDDARGGAGGTRRLAREKEKG